VGSRLTFLAASKNHRPELPVHTQDEIRKKIIIQGTRAIHCFDVDHRGKDLRDLMTKGRSMTVFPRFSCADFAFDLDADILRGCGSPGPLRGSVAAKRDHHLAAKLSPGDNLVRMGNLLRQSLDQSIDSFWSIPLGDGVSEQDRAANDALRAEVEAVVRERAAAYWLRPQWRASIRQCKGNWRQLTACFWRCMEFASRC
jgi:hypothetical protein